MFATNKEFVAHALTMWANHIETGSVTMSAQDAASRQQKSKPLTSEQMATVLHLRKLSDDALRGTLDLQAAPQGLVGGHL